MLELFIDKKAMIRNRYNYLTPSVQDMKGKKDALEATAPQSNITSRKPEGQFLSQKLVKRLAKIKTNHKDIHAKTYNDKNSKPQQKHRLVTVILSVCLQFPLFALHIAFN